HTARCRGGPPSRRSLARPEGHWAVGGYPLEQHSTRRVTHDRVHGELQPRASYRSRSRHPLLQHQASNERLAPPRDSCPNVPTGTSVIAAEYPATRTSLMDDRAASFRAPWATSVKVVSISATVFLLGMAAFQGTILPRGLLGGWP